MKRRSGPGSLSLKSSRRGGECSRKEGTEQHQHQGWQTRGARDGSSSQPPAGVAGRSPLREAAPAGNRKYDASSQSLRPHEVLCARNAGSSADGEEDKGMTLRCMYTHQKTKKRKTWSDGAVKCCPKRQRVSLYRWSDALGVTDKLLGEVYLTVPQYKAFVTQEEPELEMETFLVSLDGVIQPDNGTFTGATNSAAAGGGAERVAGGGVSGGTEGVGRKRKLFKAFKPPARRAPPPAPPSDGSRGPPPPVMMGQLWNGEPNDDDRGMMLPRTSYTGFGHVESLWADDGDGDGDVYGGEGTGRGDDRAELAPAGSAAGNNAGWGMGAGAGYACARESCGGAGTFSLPGRMQSSSSPSPSSAAASLNNTSDWMSRQEVDEVNGRHARGRSASGGLPRSAGDVAGPFSAQQRMDRFGGPADRGQDQEDLSSHQDLESLRSGDRGSEAWPAPTDSPARRGGVRDVGGARNQGHRHYPEHPWYDDDGTGAAPEGKPIERNAAASRRGGDVRDAPEAYREQPAVGRDDSGDRVGAGVVAEPRSTQDILSLFGGLEEDGDGDEHDSPGPRGPVGTTASPLRQSRGPNDAVPGPGATGGALLPAGGGMLRAVDMRRAQRESRAAVAAAAAEAAEAAGGETLSCGTGDPGTVAAASDVAARVAPPQGDWACGVCGVRGGASATSCRICGGPRQGPADEDSGFPERGGDDENHDVVDGFSGGAHQQLGWGGADFGGGQDWLDQKWGGVGGDRSAVGGREGDELGGGDREEGVLLGGGGNFVSRGHPVSATVCSPPSPVEREGGSEGGVGCSSDGMSRAPSEQHRVAGARMQIDVGSSSDSEEDS